MPAPMRNPVEPGQKVCTDHCIIEGCLDWHPEQTYIPITEQQMDENINDRDLRTMSPEQLIAEDREWRQTKNTSLVKPSLRARNAPLGNLDLPDDLDIDYDVSYFSNGFLSRTVELNHIELPLDDPSVKGNFPQIDFERHIIIKHKPPFGQNKILDALYDVSKRREKFQNRVPNKRPLEKDLAPVPMHQEAIFTTHPAVGSVNQVNIEVVHHHEGKFVVKSTDGLTATIRVPSSADIANTCETTMGTSGELVIQDVECVISHDLPVQIMHNLSSSINAITSVARETGEYCPHLDGDKIKGAYIHEYDNHARLTLKPRAGEVQATVEEEVLGFHDYHGMAMKQASSVSETVHTFIGRMTKKTGGLEPKLREAALKIVRDRMYRFLPTAEELWEGQDVDGVQARAMLDAFMKMDMKERSMMETAFNGHFVEGLEDYSVKGFNKNQWKSKWGQIFSDKAGQSVSQHSKLKNMVLKFVCYVTDSLLRSYRGAKRFIYASGKSDAEVQKELDEIMRQTEIDLIFTENDFGEFDSTQNELMPIVCTEYVQSVCGTADSILHTYINHLMEWKVVIDGLLTILNKNQKHSGEAATLLFNTIWNAAWCGVIMNVDELVVALFKGDDSLVVSKNLTIDKAGMKLLKEVGLITKLFMRKEFAFFTDMIVTPEGAALDVCRRGAKVLSKVWKKTDRNALKDMIISTNDIVTQRIGTHWQQMRCIQLNSVARGQVYAENYTNALICIAKGEIADAVRPDKVVYVSLSPEESRIGKVY
jgi:hypothetical protein